MVFSSAVFLFLFLPAVLIIYYNPFWRGRKFRNIFLLIVSLGFYAWGEPVYILLMLLSITVNWFLGLQIGKGKKAKPMMALAAVFNLSVLFVFKYLGFFLENIKALGVGIGDFGVVKIALPIGISFYTFQALSYVIDVGRGTSKAKTNILEVGLYIACFPQLIAGPIVRYETVSEEISRRKENWEDFCAGVLRFIIGLAKKTLLANAFGRIVDGIFVIHGIAVPTAWLGAVGYMLQIYFDFSGYSDMALGLGRMFGFHYLENFNYPYIASSITGFWRRWHISLSTWFRDYVYIPLGGNRVSKGKHIRNYFIVWLLTGIWHGANWTFIVWGLAYFIFLLIEKQTGLDKNEGWWGRIYTLFTVCLLWVVFRAENLNAAFTYLGAMFGIGSVPMTSDSATTLLRALPLIAAGCVCSTPLFAKVTGLIRAEKTRHAAEVLTFAVLLFLSVSCVVSSKYNPFIYFNF